MPDLTIVYITANVITDYFGNNLRRHLFRASIDLPIICVSKKPMDLGENVENIIFEGPISHFGIYRQALAGVKMAKTKFVAIAEDDVLYSPEHFKHRSSPGKFAYNVACWALFTWKDPLFSCGAFGARRNHGQLICERDLYIEAMEERFAKWPDDSKTNKEVWAEPGKYENHLGVTVRQSETFYTDPANVMFTHAEGLSFHTIGMRKRMGEMRALEIPYWGTSKKVKSLYAAD